VRDFREAVKVSELAGAVSLERAGAGALALLDDELESADGGSGVGDGLQKRKNGVVTWGADGDWNASAPSSPILSITAA